MSKIIDYKKLTTLVKKISGRNIVLAGGCFDILHPAHLKFLKAARKQAEILIVALESDEKIKKLKGSNRPLNSQIIRAKNLAKLKEGDYVLLLPEFKSDEDYLDLVKIIKPKIIAVTKNDPMIKKKRFQAKSVGAKVVEVIPYLKGHSTTRIINGSM